MRGGVPEETPEEVPDVPIQGAYAASIATPSTVRGNLRRSAPRAVSGRGRWKDRVT